MTKRLFSLLGVVATLAAVVGCSKEQTPDNETHYELRVLSFEDEDARFSAYTLDYASKEITTWSDLVDDAQYNGALLYGDLEEHTYAWYDEANTELSHASLTPYWNGGGHALSNYVIEDPKTLPEGYKGWYELQLATPMGGHNSTNFAVHHGFFDRRAPEHHDPKYATLEFKDGVERVVDHIWVTNTSYAISALKYGSDFSTQATESSSLRIVAIGYNSLDELVGTLEFTLCEGTTLVEEWTKWDLSSLGKVSKIAFNFTASEDLIGEWGLNCPAYFAYDDVAVRFEK